MTNIRLRNLAKLDLGMLSALRVILVERSVSKAAQLCNLSQPAMSHLLARMRAAFADPLLIRTRRAMALTRRGEELLEQLNELWPQLERLAQPTRFEPHLARVEFKLAVTDYAALVLGPTLVSALRRDAPHSSLVVATLQSSEIDLESKAAEFDLRLGFLAAPPASWYIRKLMEDEGVVIAGETNTLYGDELSVEEFNAAEQIGIRTSRPPHNSSMDKLLCEQGLRRNIVVWMTNFGTLPFLVSRSDLIAVFPKSLACLYCGHNGVRMIRPPFSIPGLAISMAWPARVHNDVAHAWLRSKVVEVAQAVATPVRSPGQGDFRAGDIEPLAYASGRSPFRERAANSKAIPASAAQTAPTASE